MTWLHKLTRKKTIDGIPLDTSLHRCLGTLDLTLLGIGAMVGSGIYIMTGVAAKELAGPSIVLSFVLAAVIAGLGVLCFTEFAARVPRAGGSYIYMYASLGEFAAFIMGWAILVSIVNGGATNARAWSAYLDFLLHNSISNFTQSHLAEWTVGEPIAPYPDFMASAIVVILTLVTISGANCSTKFNSFFAGANCLLLLFVIIVGFTYAQPKNWTSPETKGFLPFGWSGVISGAGACYWALTGYEIIGTCTEEAKEPKKSVPLAMGLSITIVTLLYIGTAAALTLVCPYTDLDLEAPLPSAFRQRGIEWASYVVSFGPLLGLTTTLFASIFGFTRIAYAMAEDGLLPPLCSKVANRSGVPVWSSLIGGSFMALQACFFDIRHILSFGVVLSLFQLILVSASVIILRYRPSEISKTYELEESEQSMGEGDHANNKNGGTNGMAQNILSGDVPQSPQSPDPPSLNDIESAADRITSDLPTGEDNSADKTHLLQDQRKKKSKRRRPRKKSREDTPLNSENNNTADEEILPGTLKQSFRFLQKYLNFAPGVWVCTAVGIMWIIMLLFGVAIMYGKEEFNAHMWWSTATAIVLMLFLLMLIGTIVMHKQNITHLVLKVPCVPLIPSLSILTGTILMVATATLISWIGFALVFIIGVVLYLSYGIRHSKLNDGCFELLPLTGGINNSLYDSADSEDEF